MSNSPCQDCKDRVPACSSKCQKEEYLKFREKLDKINRNKKKEQLEYSTMIDLTHKRNKRYIKKKV